MFDTLAALPIHSVMDSFRVTKGSRRRFARWPHHRSAKRSRVPRETQPPIVSLCSAAPRLLAVRHRMSRWYDRWQPTCNQRSITALFASTSSAVSQRLQSTGASAHSRAYGYHIASLSRCRRLRAPQPREMNEPRSHGPHGDQIERNQVFCPVVRASAFSASSGSPATPAISPSEELLSAPGLVQGGGLPAPASGRRSGSTSESNRLPGKAAQLVIVLAGAICTT